MKYQVESALNEINCIGQSKFHAKKKLGGKNKVVGIYSIKYFRKVIGTCIRFSRFARKWFQAKTIFDLRPEHYYAYIAQLQAENVTKGYLCNVESHLIKLQTAMHVMAEKYYGKPVVFIEKRLISWRDKEEPEDRSYTEEEICLLESNMSTNVAKAMRMSLNLGFRTVTICNVRKKHVVSHSDGRVEINIPDGKGITKGGRWLGRGPNYDQAPLWVPPSYVPELLRLIEGKEDTDRIINIKEGTLRGGLSKACKRSGVISAGFHGFRHTYARRRLEGVMGDRWTEGKMMIDYILKNRDCGRRIDYGICKRIKDQVEQDPDRLLFEWVQDCVNIVHAELGHGKSRWALVAVYMS